VTYLGFIVESKKGISMNPEKIRAVKEWAAPSDVKGVRSFVGFANFYREFISDFSEIVSPLTALTKKGVAFSWGQPQRDAFEELKERFVTAPILAHWDPELPTVVEPDCSGWALGSCLSQWHGDKLRPVAYLSNKLSPAECNYEIHDRELLGVIRSLEEWRAELTSVNEPITILTDHRNLVYFMKAQQLSERQVRWAEFLSRFHFKMVHRPGRLAGRPDALSRRKQDVPQRADDDRLQGRIQQVIKPEWLEGRIDDDSVVIMTGGTSEPIFPRGQNIFAEEELAALWDEGAAQDGALSEAYRAVLRGDRNFPPKLGYKVALAECAMDGRGALQFRGRVWVPQWEPLQTAIIQRSHDAPSMAEHPGREATREIISRQFFWPNMSNQIRQFCQNCARCGRAGIWRGSRQGLLKPLPVPDRFWSDISIDFITDLPANEKGDDRYLMVIADRLLKGVVLEAMPTMNARECAVRFRDCWWRYHSFPKTITSDRGPNWLSTFWAELCSLTGIERRLTTSYNPKSDGQVERWNQEIQTILRGVVSYAQTDWPEYLPGAMFAINNRASTVHGMSPFFVSHGWHPDVIEVTDDFDKPPEDTRSNDAGGFVKRLQEAQEVTQAAMGWAQERMERYANRTRRAVEQYKVGDQVWLDLRNIQTPRASKKLAWTHAKFIVTGVPHASVVELNTPTNIYPRFHVELVRRAPQNPLPSQVTDDPQPGPLLQATDSEEEEYQIGNILRVRRKRRGRGWHREALVKWQGYVAPTWEPLSEVEHSDAYGEFVREFGNGDDTGHNVDAAIGRKQSTTAEQGERPST
jgi:hypothetical protein